MIRPVLLADGRIVYDARVGDGPQRRFTRKRDAEEYEAKEKQTRLRVRAGLQTTEVGGATFLDLCQLWEANFAPSPWKLSMLAHSKQKWGRHRLTELRPEQIGAWLHSLPLAGKTKSHVLSALRQVLEAGVDWGYVTRNPARKGAFKAPSTKRQRPILPFESWAQVLDAAKAVASQGEPVSSPLIRFACATGVRCPGELLNVTRNQLDLKGRLLEVQGTKTAHAMRTIPLSELALAALDDIALPIKSTDPIWRNRHGRTLSYINWRDTDWRLGLEEAGLKQRTPYEMRHTFATLALGSGAAIDDVASMMGHTDIDEVYRFYRKWIPQMSDRLRSVLNTIGKEQDEHRLEMGP